MRRRFRLRWVLSALCLLPAVFLVRPAYLWTRAWLDDRPADNELPPQHVDDASR